MARPLDTARRQELLAAALPYLAEHGLAGLSLKPLAAALGTSDRMLVHYFGTKENLVGLALTAARPDVPALLTAAAPSRAPVLGPAAAPGRAPALGPAGDTVGASPVQALARRLWADLTGDGPQRPRVRVLLEVMALALTQPVPYGAYAAAAVHDWVVPIATTLARTLAISDDQAEARATVLVSGLRGLALDRYITGDTARTDTAAMLLIDQTVNSTP